MLRKDGGLLVVYDVVVVVVHEDGDWLTNDDGHPYSHVTHLTVQVPRRHVGQG